MGVEKASAMMRANVVRVVSIKLSMCFILNPLS